MTQTKNTTATHRRIAFATTDGHAFTTDHFGSADIYAIYSYDGVDFRHLENLHNATEEEAQDSEPGKAKSILDLLAMRDVSIVAAKRFGPNIKRIRHRLVPVVASTNDITTTLPALKAEWDAITMICNLPPEERHHLVLSSSESASQTTAGKLFAKIKAATCRGCMRCAISCPVDAITMGQAKAVIDKERCVACGTCVPMCPFDAIELEGSH